MDPRATAPCRQASARRGDWTTLLALGLVVGGLLGAPRPATGHSGGLDAAGCHHNRKTGDYHCHRAPAARAPRIVSPPGRDSKATGMSCGAKTYCTEMTSCQEAMFYYSKCGLTRLDGDSDGVPCEKLCR